MLFLLTCVNLWFHLQVKQRADECILALDTLIKINSGIPVQNVLKTQFDWTTLEVTFLALCSSFSFEMRTRQQCTLFSKKTKRVYNKTGSMCLEETTHNASWSMSAGLFFFFWITASQVLKFKIFVLYDIAVLCLQGTHRGKRKQETQEKQLVTACNSVI